jgi:hypothetical protein
VDRKIQFQFGCHQGRAHGRQLRRPLGVARRAYLRYVRCRRGQQRQPDLGDEHGRWPGLSRQCVRESFGGRGKISLIVRETTPGGTSVGSHVTAITATSGWQQITSTYTAKNRTDYIRYSVYSSNLAGSSQNFLADCLSLWSRDSQHRSTAKSMSATRTRTFAPSVPAGGGLSALSASPVPA